MNEWSTLAYETEPVISLVLDQAQGVEKRVRSLLLLSVARIRDQLDRRSSGKSVVKAFSITFGFATNKIISDGSLAEGTIYILNNVPKTTSNLPKAPMLSAD